MAIEMRWTNPQRHRAVDLGAELALDLGSSRSRRNSAHLPREGTVRIEQAADLVRRRDAAPAIRLPFAGEREMQAEIGVRMRPGVRGDLGDPRRRHHDARGRDGALVERVEACRIDGMGDGEIVRVENEELRVGRVAESLGDCPGLGLKR